MSDTVDLYHRRRRELLSRIGDHDIPMCEWCGRLLYFDISKLYVHHVNEEQGHEHGIGGWQHLLKLEEEEVEQEEVELEPLCHSCHDHVHDKSIWAPLLEVGA